MTVAMRPFTELSTIARWFAAVFVVGCGGSSPVPATAPQWSPTIAGSLTSVASSPPAAEASQEAHRLVIGAAGCWSSERDALAWAGVLQGFSDKLKADADPIWSSTDLGRVVTVTFHRLEAEYKAQKVAEAMLHSSGARLEPATRRLTVEVAGPKEHGTREKRPLRETRSPEIERATGLTAHSQAHSIADPTDDAGDGKSQLAKPSENDANGGSRQDPEAVLKGAIARLTRNLLTVPDGAIPGLIAERAALRAELQELTDDAMMRLDEERTR